LLNNVSVSREMLTAIRDSLVVLDGKEEYDILLS
jgi:hypothetical protein